MDESEATTERRGATYCDAIENIDRQCRLLMKNFADDRGIGLAAELTAAYRQLTHSDRREFFDLLLERYAPDYATIVSAAQTYQSTPSYETHQGLRKAVESPRQQLFRCINMAPDGLSTLVRMRSHLMELTVPERVKTRAVNQDLKQLFRSWFNRGFLELQAIDWKSPASLLEKLIEYEAVHQIRGWDDLRGRLEQDRRCFAFFHPSMPEEPLVFVEVALTQGIASEIGPLIDKSREVLDAQQADTAVFYSISNCQDGLHGVAFGGFLIKRAVQELYKDLPQLRTFCTLSPIPTFRTWLSEKLAASHCDESLRQLADFTQEPDATDSTGRRERITSVREPLMRLCAHYLVNEKMGRGPLDPVARFHLGNGASLGRLNWLADTSAKGIEQSAGIMVNYVYRIEDMERNQQIFASGGEVVATEEIKQLAAGADQLLGGQIA